MQGVNRVAGKEKCKATEGILPSVFKFHYAFWLQANRTSNVWTNLWQYESGSEKESNVMTAHYPH